MIVLFLVFFKNFHTVFHGYTNLHSHQHEVHMRVPFPPHPYHHLFLTFSITVILPGVRWYFTVILICTSLAICDGEGNGNPLQHSCLENPMVRGAWWAAVRGVAKSRTWLSDFTFAFHFHALEKEMAAHSSVLAWRIPGVGEPGGLPSMGSHRVGHAWSDLAAAAAMICDADHLYTCLLVICMLCKKNLFKPSAHFLIGWFPFWYKVIGVI